MNPWAGARQQANAGHARRAKRIAPTGSIAGREAARRARITYRQLDYWLTTYRGFAASIGTNANPGSGIGRTIRVAAMPKLHVTADLVRFGLPVPIVMSMTHQKRLRLRAVMAPHLHRTGSERKVA